MIWWKMALPALVAGSGIAAIAVDRATDDRSGTVGLAAAWIDAPVDGTQLSAGPVTVQAHTNSGATSLTLFVDGEEVATDDELEVSDQLAYASFEWEAAVGVHTLEVRTAAGTSSVGSVVLVADPSASPPTTAPPTTEPSVSTTTSTPSTTTTTSTTTSTTAVASTVPATTRPTTPPTRPPTTPPIPTPTVSSAALLLDSNSCTARATAQVQGATSVSVRFSGPNVEETVAAGAGPLVNVAASSVSFSDGTYTATFTATGPGGVTVASASATIGNCKP